MRNGCEKENPTIGDVEYLFADLATFNVKPIYSVKVQRNPLYAETIIMKHFWLCSWFWANEGEKIEMWSSSKSLNRLMTRSSVATCFQSNAVLLLLLLLL